MINFEIMRKDASLPVRLDLDEKRRLKVAAEQMGLTVSALIRLLVRSFVDEYDRQNGRIALPPDWHEVLGSSTTEARKVAESAVAYMNRSKTPRKNRG